MQNSVSRNLSTRWMIAIVVALAVVLAATWQSRALANSSDESAAVAVSDAEIFAGVVLGAGPVAEKLPTGLAPAAPSFSDEEIENYVNLYESRFPGEIAVLADSVREGSLSDVKIELEKTGVNVVEVASEGGAVATGSAEGACLIFAVVFMVAISVVQYVDVEHRVSSAPPYPQYQMAGIDPAAGELQLDRLVVGLQHAVSP